MSRAYSVRLAIDVCHVPYSLRPAMVVCHVHTV